MDYEQKYKEALGWMRGMYDGLHGKTKKEAEHFFPELKESEDERIRKELIEHIKANCESDFILFQKFSPDEVIAWLEKQGKPKWNENDEHHWMMCVACVEECATQEREDFSKTIDWLKSLKQRMGEHEKQGEQNLASSAKTCKNDTLLDLLNKMPSCITVDGIDYHFVLKKTIAYMAFYEGEGEEGKDKIIFWMAGDPIVLLTAMLEKLKEEGLLE